MIGPRGKGYFSVDLDNYDCLNNSVFGLALEDNFVLFHVQFANFGSFFFQLVENKAGHL